MLVLWNVQHLYSYKVSICPIIVDKTKLICLKMCSPAHMIIYIAWKLGSNNKADLIDIIMTNVFTFPSNIIVFVQNKSKNPPI